MNSSFLVNFNIDVNKTLFDEDLSEYELLKVEIRKLLENAKTRISLIKLEHYRSSSVIIDNVIIILISKEGLQSKEFLILNARWVILNLFGSERY